MLVIQKVMFAFLFLIVGAGGVIGLNHYKIISIERPMDFIDSSVDADGVPFLKDYNNPVVKGVAYTKRDFKKKYCEGLVLNRTCNIVQNRINMEPAKIVSIPRFGNVPIPNPFGRK